MAQTSFFLPQQAGPSSSALNDKLSKHLDELFGSFPTFAAPPSPMNEQPPPVDETPFAGPSEYDSDEDVDGSEAGMDDVEYTFADVSDVRDEQEDESWLTPGAPVPELEPSQKQDDDDDDEEMEDAPEPSPKQGTVAPPPSYLLEEFGLDIHGQFDGVDLGEKPRPAGYVEGSGSLPAATAATEPSFWDFGAGLGLDGLDSASLQGLMGGMIAGGSNTGGQGKDKAKEMEQLAQHEAWWTGGDLSPSAFSALASWCGNVAVHDPAGPTSFPTFSTPGTASTTTTMSWPFDPLGASIRPPQVPQSFDFPSYGSSSIGMASAPPSAFTFTPPTFTSTSGPSSSSVSDTSSDEAARSRPAPPPRTAPIQQSHTDHPTRRQLPEPASAPQPPYTADRLAAIAAAAKTSLEQPSGRKSSHHGRKSSSGGAARQPKPSSSATKRAVAPKAKFTTTVAPKPRAVKAAVPKLASVSEESEDGVDVKGKKYVCGSCGKTFSRPYNLKVHKETHKGVKKHCCPLQGCVKAFSRRHDLTRHLEAYHEPWLEALGCTPQEASADGFVPPQF